MYIYGFGQDTVTDKLKETFDIMAETTKTLEATQRSNRFYAFGVLGILTIAYLLDKKRGKKVI